MEKDYIEELKRVIQQIDDEDTQPYEVWETAYNNILDSLNNKLYKLNYKFIYGDKDNIIYSILPLNIEVNITNSKMYKTDLHWDVCFSPEEFAIFSDVIRLMVCFKFKLYNDKIKQELKSHFGKGEKL